MSSPARAIILAPVPSRNVRLVAGLTVLSWLGMVAHDQISLPEMSLLAPEIVLPTLMSLILFGAWWLWPGRLSLGLLLGWTVLHFAVGGLLSVLPWPFLPFVPEQTVRHYVAHAVYAACQVPLLVVLLRGRPRPAA
jgi:hypothetical protein